MDIALNPVDPKVSWWLVGGNTIIRLSQRCMQQSKPGPDLEKAWRRQEAVLQRPFIR